MTGKILYIGVFSVFSAVLAAQPLFVSKELSSIYNNLAEFNPGQPELLSISHNQNQQLKYYSTGIKVHGQLILITIEKSYDSLITHLGVHLFNEYPEIYSKFIYQFPERYLLKVLVMQGKNPFQKEDGVTLILNDKQFDNSNSDNSRLVSLLNNFTSIKLSKADDFFILNMADNSSNILELKFDIRYELITGMDKKELDEFVYTGLSGRPEVPQNNFELSIPAEYNLINLYDDVYTDKNDRLVEGITNSKFYILNNSKPVLLFDEKYPAESVRNIFFEPILTHNGVNMSIQQKMYGGKTSRYKSSLNNFTNYFEGTCELYTGVESVTEDSVKILVIYYETDLKLIHLAIISINSYELFEGDNTNISCRLFANIRTDNISNIFKDYTIKKNKFNINVD